MARSVSLVADRVEQQREEGDDADEADDFLEAILEASGGIQEL